jgi:hypothetical protein
VLPTDLHGTTIAKTAPRADGKLAAATTGVVIALREAIRKLGPRARPQLEQIQSFFALSDSSEFVNQFEPLLMRARRVILIGIGLNFLYHEPLRQALMQRAAAGECELEIYLADPFSPAVESRLIEEEAGAMTPPVGKPNLLKRLDGLLDDWQRNGSPPNVQIRLFAHYPTFALLIVDDDYFVYPYAYATLGNFSPVMRFSAHQPHYTKAINFFRAHYERVRKASVSAALKKQIREGLGVGEEPLFAFAIYFVPPRGSPLYDFGSQVLGYDIHTGTRLQTEWERQVGSAAQFGFHLTVCDVLYFLNSEEVALAGHTAALLARDYAPFKLANLRVESRFPNENSIAIVCDDPTGNLEALHSEFVALINRRASASNYSLGKAGITRDDDTRRAELMIRRFRAPYVLKKFRPHFTLMTAVNEDEHEALGARLKSEFAKLPSHQIRVEKLALMERPSVNSAWTVKKEIPLGPA